MSEKRKVFKGVLTLIKIMENKKRLLSICLVLVLGLMVSFVSAQESNFREVRVGSDTAGIINNVGVNNAYALCNEGEKVIAGSGTCNTPWEYPKSDFAYLISSSPLTSRNQNNQMVEGWASTCVGKPTEELLKSSQNIVTAICVSEEFYNENFREVRVGSDTAGIINNVGVNNAYALCNEGEKVIAGSGTCNTPWEYPKSDFAYLISSSPLTSRNQNNQMVEGWASTCVGKPTEELLKSSQNIVTAICVKEVVEITPNETTGPIDVTETTPETNVTETTPEKNYVCNGCSLNKKCYPFGYRIEEEYCTDEGNFSNQKEAGLSCDNSFECSTNLCVDNECISSGFWQAIMNFFKKIFG